MNILIKKQHLSGLIFRPSPDFHAIEISKKLSFPGFLAEFYENNWVLLENLELSFSILLKKQACQVSTIVPLSNCLGENNQNLSL